MKYKRLTTEKEYGCGLCKDRKCKKPKMYCKDRLACEIYNRLAELEDKIEQGTLIELPCKMGVMVYGIEKDLDEDYDYFYFIRKMKFRFYLFDNWGDTVFLTREEAEKRLKELQE